MFAYFLLLLGCGYAVASDGLIKEAVVPSSKTASEGIENDYFQLLDIYKKDDTVYRNLKRHLVNGNLKKGLTFNIFDSNMKEAIKALYDLTKSIEKEQIPFFQTWAENHINPEMLDYVYRLNILYSNNTIINSGIQRKPPFILNPYYYVNSEAIIKALKIRLGMLNEDEEIINEIERSSRFIIINANNSGWNLASNGCDKEITYFREDISLNGYYYALHLLHPFWMSFEELDEINPRHAEHYYFAQQQLLVRYLLERQHIEEDSKPLKVTIDCENTFHPYLMYENGLPFPISKKIEHQMDKERTELSKIDILLKECIARGIILEPGTAKNISESDDMNSIARFVLKKLDSFEVAKEIRHIYGGQTKAEYLYNYNPAPSILNNYQTSLRDSLYWGLLDYANSYFSEYKSIIPPFDLSLYEDKEVNIQEAYFDKILTRFENFQFNVSEYINNFAKYPNIEQDILIRTKRLTHSPFQITFNVISHFRDRLVNVKIFLGPKCYNSCWEQYNRFFQLDTYLVRLRKGLNSVTWDPEKSSMFSFDDYFNLDSDIEKVNRYNFFKFPVNLLLPKGSADGTKMTLFVMINSVENEDDFNRCNLYSGICFYNKLLCTYDKKPLGFPFHKRAFNYKELSTNYRFFNVTIYHDS